MEIATRKETPFLDNCYHIERKRMREQSYWDILFCRHQINSRCIPFHLKSFAPVLYQWLISRRIYVRNSQGDAWVMFVGRLNIKIVGAFLLGINSHLPYIRPFNERQETEDSLYVVCDPSRYQSNLLGWIPSLYLFEENILTMILCRYLVLHNKRFLIYVL